MNANDGFYCEEEAIDKGNEAIKFLTMLSTVPSAQFERCPAVINHHNIPVTYTSHCIRLALKFVFNFSLCYFISLYYFSDLFTIRLCIQCSKAGCPFNSRLQFGDDFSLTKISRRQYFSKF